MNEIQYNIDLEMLEKVYKRSKKGLWLSDKSLYKRIQERRPEEKSDLYNELANEIVIT